MVIENLNAEQKVLIVNQIVGNTIMKSARELGFENQLKAEYDKKQSKSGVFEVQVTNSAVENLIKNHVTFNELFEIKESIRNAFNLGNSFIVENDELVPGSRVTNINISQINESFNKQYSTYLKDKVEELKANGKIDSKVVEDIDDEGFLNNGMVLYLALGACAVAFIYFQSKKKN